MEDLYSNPRNLNFYLAEGEIQKVKSEIIKNKFFTTEFGQLEIAIIGASHYMKLGNLLFEMLSCLPEDLENESLLLQRKNIVSLKENLELDFFSYEIAINQRKYEHSRDFNSMEKKIFKSKHSLIYAFDGDSALTALALDLFSHKISLKSIHSYPDYGVIVYSNSHIMW